MKQVSEELFSASKVDTDKLAEKMLASYLAGYGMVGNGPILYSLKKLSFSSLILPVPSLSLSLLPAYGNCRQVVKEQIYHVFFYQNFLKGEKHGWKQSE